MTQQVMVKNPKMYAFVLMISGFMGLFSETALNMALTDIMQDFQVPAATVQW
ncbi:MFS transporter, partial [Enterobacter mori]